MARDIVYIYDKISKKRAELGEIQTDFNQSFVIDGTKDSCCIVVWSWSNVEIEPNTILYHPKTDTWWIVSHDKVERYFNENSFAYTHTIDLLGAVDLLNARDLTDCGFNDNTYTVRQFITRLFSLSTFEYAFTFSQYISADFLDKNVDFIKTFENYTLLSAIREFLDAYNMCLKLSFVDITSGDDKVISYAVIKIVPKTGDSSLPTHNIDDFDNVRETRVIDRNSFGTTVISNAENVISTKEKTYPSTGSVKLSGTEDTITPSTAILRLPSKVFKGNWIKMRYYLRLGIMLPSYEKYVIYYPANNRSLDNIIQAMYEFASQKVSAAYANSLLADLLENKETLRNKLEKASCVTFYEGNKITTDFTGQTGKVVIEQGNNVPYLTQFNDGLNSHFNMIFTDKQTKQMLPKVKSGVAWERGSNIITGFEFLSSIDSNAYDAFTLSQTDLQTNNSTFYEFTNGGTQIGLYHVGGGSVATYFIDRVHKESVSFVVNYVPMTDLKVKVDNQRDKKDIQLYNQNGKLTDNVALSKLLNSYSKEISSDTITKFGTYTNLNDVPKVGSFVYDGNEIYVINNVSLTFTQNETKYVGDFNYYIDGEFTMSKYFSTKSLMVNPNTNIRDYGIPQNFNVKRKQLYRDYYELAYSFFDDANQESPYLATNIPFAFTTKTNLLSDFIGIIKLGYAQQLEGQDYWYYQLETTNYYLDKMLYVVLDFNDNNIIGYGSQNVFSGFDVSRIFSNMTDNLNTPISYTDDSGKVESINIAFCTNEQITTIYNTYQDSHGGSSWEGNLYNYSVFIAEDIYNAALSNNEIIISENSYNKDALEVPVFEYACQIDDSDNVLIGDNILQQRENCLYFYTYKVATANQHFDQNNVADNQSVVWSADNLRVNNGAKITYEDKKLYLELYSSERFDTTDMSWHYGADYNISSDYDALEYLQNNGTQYIDLELTPSTDYEYELVYTDVSGSGSNYVMGSRVSTSTIYAGVTGASATRTITIANTDLSVSNYRVANKKYYVRTKYTSNNDGTTYLKNITDGDDYTGTQNASLSGATANVCVFALNPSNIHSGMKVHSLKIWKNGVLVRDMIPARKLSTNQSGLFDRVNNKLYTNKGSGTFITPASPTRNTVNEIAVFRIAYDTTTGGQTSDLMFIARNVPNANKFGNRITLFTNYYKLK